jgi:hypothetical protein
MTEKSPKLSEQALISYRAKIEHLSFLKKQQWNLTNYIVAIYAAIFGIQHIVHQLQPWQKGLLIVLAISAFVYGFIALCVIQCDIKEERTLLEDLERGIFGADEKIDERLFLKEPNLPLNALRHIFFLGFIFVLFSGALLVAVFLWPC